jgi:hypothetical protein
MADISPESKRPRFTPRFLFAVAVVWLSFAVFYLTDASCNFYPAIFLTGSGVLIGSTWLALSVADWANFRRPYAKWWLAVPLFLLAGVALSATDQDLALRVVLCENALNDAVAEVQADSTVQWKTHRVGLFQVHDVREYFGGVYFFTSQSFIDHEGVARIPAGAPVAPRMRVRHLYGDWYVFVWRF